MLDLARSKEPFVAFVGAGGSALPPSRLPTWTEFNGYVLESLCASLDDYSGKRQPTAQMLAAFRQRRDETRFFAPDFQAQLMEEEVGGDYFHVWQSLETDTFGPVHAALAELAQHGRIAAVISTNFDRLIERALEARGVAFRVFHDEAAFTSLRAFLDAGDGAIPVVKIHGSIEDAASLVDTLAQRVVGRPPALTSALNALLVRHPWVFLGFSGADLNYDPHYLGLLDAASEARGFIFLAREGTPVQPGVARLAEAYGPPKASIVVGDLSTWPSSTFGLAAPPAVENADALAAAATASMRDGIRVWTSRLGPVAVVNIIVAMLKSAGLEHQASWLLRKTFKSYRTPGDLTTRSYQRYNLNYGVALLNVGLIENPIARADDGSNFSEWKEHADQNAVEYLGRAYREGGLSAAGAYAASAFACRGEVGKAIHLASEATDLAIASKNGIAICDAAIASAPIYDIVQFFGPPITRFRQCLGNAKRIGDEPRRAMLCALLGRFLTYRGEFDDAAAAIEEAERIAERLDLQHVRLHTVAASGLWLAESRTSPEEAVQRLSALVDEIHARDAEPLFTKVDLGQEQPQSLATHGRHPMLCRVLLDLNRAALFAGDATVVNGTLDELDRVATDVFLGYCPHYYLAYAQCMLSQGDDSPIDFIRELIDRARDLGERSGNPWPAQASDHLERQIAAMS